MFEFSRERLFENFDNVKGCKVYDFGTDYSVEMSISKFYDNITDEKQAKAMLKNKETKRDLEYCVAHLIWGLCGGIEVDEYNMVVIDDEGNCIDIILKA